LRLIELDVEQIWGENWECVVFIQQYLSKNCGMVSL
jgi:hypothetical protein